MINIMNDKCYDNGFYFTIGDRWRKINKFEPEPQLVVLRAYFCPTQFLPHAPRWVSPGPWGAT